MTFVQSGAVWDSDGEGRVLPFIYLGLLLALWSPTGQGLQTGVLASINSSDGFGERKNAQTQE